MWYTVSTEKNEGRMGGREGGKKKENEIIGTFQMRISELPTTWIKVFNFISHQGNAN